MKGANVVVRLKRAALPVVRIPSEINDLFLIRQLRWEVWRDLQYRQAGLEVSIQDRGQLLLRLEHQYRQKHGKSPDVSRIAPRA